MRARNAWPLSTQRPSVQIPLNPSTQNRSPNTMSKNQTESKPQSVEEPQEEGLDETACSVSYLEGALAKAKTWSIHNSPYAHHLPEHNDWLRGYADYPEKLSSLNAESCHLRGKETQPEK
jgi:hypothetical protein